MGTIPKVEQGPLDGNYLELQVNTGIKIPPFWNVQNQNWLILPGNLFLSWGVLPKQRVYIGCPCAIQALDGDYTKRILRFCQLWNLMALCFSWSCSSGHPQKHLEKGLNVAQSLTSKSRDLISLAISSEHPDSSAVDNCHSLLNLPSTFLQTPL